MSKIFSFLNTNSKTGASLFFISEMSSQRGIPKELKMEANLGAGSLGKELGVLDRHLLALSEICKELENLIEEIKEPNSEILKRLLNLLNTLKYWLLECQNSLNYGNISTTQAIQQTLSVLLQKKENNLPKDLRNKAQALVGKVKDLEALALCNNLVDWSSVDPTQLLPADIDMIENDLNALIAILPSLNISESVIDTLETLLQELKEISQNQDPNYILILNPLSRALEDLKLQIEARLQSAQTATSGQEQGGAEAEQH